MFTAVVTFITTFSYLLESYKFITWFIAIILISLAISYLLVVMTTTYVLLKTIWM